MNSKFASMVGKGSELASDLCGGSTMERLLSERGLTGSVSVDEHKVKHAVRNAMVGVVATALADLAVKQGKAVVALTDDEEKDIAAVLGSAIAPKLPARVRGPRPPRKRKAAEKADSEEECDWAKARPSWEPAAEPSAEAVEVKEQVKEAEESSGEETLVASGPTKESSQAEKDAAKERARVDWMNSLLAPA
jgi:hypothetical protein